MKLETIRSLLDLIKTAHLVNNNVPNLSTDTGEYTVTITVRKSQQKNKFWMHEIRITKKEQGLSSSGDVNPQQEYNKTLAHKGIVSQDPDSVKSEEGNVLYSDRDPDSISNRALLANALESRPRTRMRDGLQMYERNQKGNLFIASS